MSKIMFIASGYLWYAYTVYLYSQRKDLFYSKKKV